MEIALVTLVFGCVFLFVIGLHLLVQAPATSRRLAKLGGAADAAPMPGSGSLIRSRTTGIARFFQTIGQGHQTEEAGPIRMRLIHANYRSPAAPAIYFGVRLTLSLALPALAALVPAVWNLPATQQIGLMCVLAAIGYLGPSIYVDQRVKSRKHKIVRALPDALDLMVVCVEAGFGINQTLVRVAEEFAIKSPILSHELHLSMQETRAGKGITDALRGLADRTDIGEISSLVGLLVQTERFGTSMANALRVHAEAMRIRRMQYAEERAQKATLKLILPSTMIFAALMMIFLTPGMHAFMGALSQQ